MDTKFIKTLVKINDIYFSCNEFRENQKNNHNQDKLNSFRDTLRIQVQDLLNHSYNSYTPKIVEYLIVPVIAYLDENVRTTLQPYHMRWDSFQSEFLDRNDLGEYFFKLADDIICDDIYPREVYAGFWLSLRIGFCGKYYDNDKSKLSLYRKHIQRELQILMPNNNSNMLAGSEDNLSSKPQKNILFKTIAWLKKQKFIYTTPIILTMPIILYIFTFMR